MRWLLLALLSGCGVASAQSPDPCTPIGDPVCATIDGAGIVVHGHRVCVQPRVCPGGKASAVVNAYSPTSGPGKEALGEYKWMED